MDINIDEFILPIEVVVMKMRGLDRVQMIIGRPFLATFRAIINVDQGIIIIRSREDYITYEVSGQYNYPKHDNVPKEEPNMKVEEEDKIKEPEGKGLAKQALNRM
ncbi:hypothetical protein MTR_4g033750 [Medicago truncatula]|uniref:Uncharacterized protein n=1 Tax=Medicago truncatula TaxID=3880 RepID=G7JP89_MEDTR|nr:hypothetical protein MTR_4g033750 [Medicago truncatula]